MLREVPPAGAQPWCSTAVRARLERRRPNALMETASMWSSVRCALTREQHEGEVRLRMPLFTLFTFFAGVEFIMKTNQQYLLKHR